MLIRTLESRFLNRLMVAIFWGEFLELRKYFLQKKGKENPKLALKKHKK